jgi:opacity protein-like surface antigen
MRRALMMGLLVAALTSAVNAQDVEVLKARPERTGNQRPVRFEFNTSWTFGIDADELFRDYQTVFGGRASGFDVPVGFGASLSTYQLDDVSIGVTAGYYRAVVRENYDYRPLLRDTSFGPSQNVTQNMALTCIPAMLSVEYFPVFRQFTGYVGLGAGIGNVSFRWDEEISNSTLPGARRGGARYDRSHIVPAIQLRTGVSLGLDGEVGKNVRAAITLEGGYLYMPLSAAIMRDAAASFVASVPDRLRSDYRIQTGGMQLRIGFLLFVRPPAKSMASS